MGILSVFDQIDSTLKARASLRWGGVLFLYAAGYLSAALPEFVARASIEADGQALAATESIEIAKASRVTQAVAEATDAMHAWVHSLYEALMQYGPVPVPDSVRNRVESVAWSSRSTIREAVAILETTPFANPDMEMARGVVLEDIHEWVEWVSAVDSVVWVVNASPGRRAMLPDLELFGVWNVYQTTRRAGAATAWSDAGTRYAATLERRVADFQARVKYSTWRIKLVAIAILYIIGFTMFVIFVSPPATGQDSSEPPVG